MQRFVAPQKSMHNRFDWSSSYGESSSSSSSSGEQFYDSLRCMCLLLSQPRGVHVPADTSESIVWISSDSSVWCLVFCRVSRRESRWKYPNTSKQIEENPCSFSAVLRNSHRLEIWRNYANNQPGSGSGNPKKIDTLVLCEMHQAKISLHILYLWVHIMYTTDIIK